MQIIPGTVCRARKGLTPQGHGRIYIDYLIDVGALHVLDYRLWLTSRDWLDPKFRARTSFVLPRIGRYLDGEEETEGTYR